MKSQQENNIMEQLYYLSRFYERCRIPYLIKFLDLLSYCGIKFACQTQIKENQIVAFGFFLQNIKGMTKSMTYKQLIGHIKVSTHDYPEFKANTHLFEIIYNYKCEIKETFKAIYVSNQLLMDNDEEEGLSYADFVSKVEELFSTEDLNNGVITLDFLIKELQNIQNELKGFFFFFNKYIQGAKTNFGLITSKLIDNPLTKRLSIYKGKCVETYEKLNPLTILLSYYSHYAEIYQINEKYSNAKKVISDGVSYSIAIPLECTNLIFKPLNNMKVIVLERVIKLKTDLSSASSSSRNRVIEISNKVIENIKAQYGEMSAWISVKGNEINVVVKTKFTSLNQQWLLDYIQMIKEINYYEAICNSKKILCSYYKQWLTKGETEEETEGRGEDNEEEKEVKTKENGNSIQKPIELELSFSMVQGDPNSK